MTHERTSAIILAAGVARRLAPLTDHTQKSLLPVGGRAILARSCVLHPGDCRVDLGLRPV